MKEHNVITKRYHNGYHHRYCFFLLWTVLFFLCNFVPEASGFVSTPHGTNRKLLHPQRQLRNYPLAAPVAARFSKAPIAESEKDGGTRLQTALLNAGVGAIVWAGGIAGFVTKGSRASLLAGSTFGGLLVVSALLVARDSSPSRGHRLAGLTSGPLALIMGKKYWATGVYLPAGFIATLAAIAFVYNSVDALVAGADDKEEEPGEL